MSSYHASTEFCSYNFRMKIQLHVFPSTINKWGSDIIFSYIPFHDEWGSGEHTTNVCLMDDCHVEYLNQMVDGKWDDVYPYIISRVSNWNKKEMIKLERDLKYINFNKMIDDLFISIIKRMGGEDE